MSTGFRVVHYLNQFFGGIGGEEKASEGPQVKDGLVGLGRAIQDALKERGEVVATVICGDNYFAERTEEAVQETLQMMKPYRPDIVIAGPAFNAGRYGIACGEICKAAQDKLGIPAVTGMYEENPGVDLYKKDVYIVKTAESAKGTAEVALRMVNIALKLVAKEKMDKPVEEGYFPRGIIVNERTDKTAARRAVLMVLAKIKGEPFEPELELPKFDRMKPPPPITDLASARIALVTDGGLVPKGNPDKMESHKATRFASINIKGLNALGAEDFEANHIGYDTAFINQDPNRLVPLDVMRNLEKEGVTGRLHDKVYATAGVATSLDNSKIIGQGIAEHLTAEGVDGVILTSTWGTSTRCGAAITKELERAGIPVAHVCTMTPIALMVGSNRIVPGSGVVHPVGNADLEPKAEKTLRRAIVDKALEALQTELTEQKLFPRPT